MGDSSSSPALSATHRRQDVGSTSRRSVTVRVWHEQDGRGGTYDVARSANGGVLTFGSPRDPVASGASTTPEQFVAIGCAASLHQTLRRLAQRDHVDPSRMTVEATIAVEDDSLDTSHPLGAELTVHLPGVDREVAQSLISRAEENDLCSRMLRQGLPVRMGLAR